MRFIVYFIFLFLTWLALTYSLSLPNVITGIIVSLITAIIFVPHFFDKVHKIFHPGRILWLLLYIVILVWECVKANFDVAYRVLHPDMPIKPGIVKVKLAIQTQFGRTVLANSITMTPGTISVDIIDDYLYIHWIYVNNPDPEVYSRKIAGRFEKYLIKIFD
jgi:multicomponent Na+:H+ antiporter subunit E